MDGLLKMSEIEAAFTAWFGKDAEELPEAWHGFAVRLIPYAAARASTPLCPECREKLKYVCINNRCSNGVIV
jgi:hypothetical protein